MASWHEASAGGIGDGPQPNSMTMLCGAALRAISWRQVSQAACATKVVWSLYILEPFSHLGYVGPPLKPGASVGRRQRGQSLVVCSNCYDEHG